MSGRFSELQVTVLDKHTHTYTIQDTSLDQNRRLNIAVERDVVRSLQPGLTRLQTYIEP